MEVSTRIGAKENTIASPIQQSHLQQQTHGLNAKAAVKYVGIALSTLYKHTSAGNIPYHKPGGKLISFKIEDLEAWLNEGRIPSNREIAEDITSINPINRLNGRKRSGGRR